MVKTAKFTAIYWELTCPSCDEPLPNPGNGSHLWTAEDLHSRRLVHSADLGTGRDSVGTSCLCGEWVRIPKALLDKAAL